MSEEWPESAGGTRRYFQGPLLEGERWSRKKRQYSPDGPYQIRIGRPFEAVFSLPEEVWEVVTTPTNANEDIKMERYDSTNQTVTFTKVMKEINIPEKLLRRGGKTHDKKTLNSLEGR